MIDVVSLYQFYENSSGICTDSRLITDGCLFFALKGENFNGNYYAKQAIDNGAKYAIIDEEAYQLGEEYLLVENAEKTLQDLAHYHRCQFDIPVIGITGSNGKTTTKELINTILSKVYKTHYTKGNLNNHIGVPITLLNMPFDTEIAVIEMGANHPNEIAFLCDIVEPTHGVITNVGKAHLEGFGDIETIMETKGALYRSLSKKSGIAFINVKYPYLLNLSPSGIDKVLYGKQEGEGFICLDCSIVPQFMEPTISFFVHDDLRHVNIITKLYGAYNLDNIITAITIGRYFKVSIEQIKLGLETYVPTNNRSQLLKIDSNTFILDAYNANPSSMQLAIENFSSINALNKIVVLGDMLELGESSTQEHCTIIELIKSKQFTDCWFVGELFSTFNKVGKHFKNVQELKSWFDEQTFKNTYFLIKGSRGIQLEKLLG